MDKRPVYQINKFSCKESDNYWYVNDFKTHLLTNSFIEESHSHNFYLLVLFTEGCGSHDIDFDRFAIKRGSMFFLKPGQVHSWQLSEDIEGYIAFYSQEVYNVHFGNKKLEGYSFYKGIKNKPELVLSDSELTWFTTYFELLLTENNGNDYKKKDKILNLLDSIHIEIERQYQGGNQHVLPAYNLKIYELERLIALHYKEEKLPSFYASKMHISLKHLNRICKSVLNMTATAVIYSTLILESKRLLSDKKRSVSDVADACGFENYSYFTKVFKRHSGVTPQDFRKQLLS